MTCENCIHTCVTVRNSFFYNFFFTPQPCLSALYSLSNQATHEAIHLLSRMLVFNPDKRISCTDALAHPYLDEGRLRYHTCMCQCCHNTPAGRHYTSDFEPVAPQRFDSSFEDGLASVHEVKGENC